MHDLFLQNVHAKIQLKLLVEFFACQNVWVQNFTCQNPIKTTGLNFGDLQPPLKCGISTVILRFSVKLNRFLQTAHAKFLRYKVVLVTCCVAYNWIRRMGMRIKHQHFQIRTTAGSDWPSLRRFLFPFESKLSKEAILQQPARIQAVTSLVRSTYVRQVA
jgi:hypothetical protein